MKKRILTLLLAAVLAVATVFALASCDLTGGGGGGGGCTVHNDADKNHKCDNCKTTLTQCADEDKDHKCDICKTALTQCADEDGDHACDICEEILSQCADENNDHKCDVCEEPLSECADTDEDHDCDLCGETLSQCADTDEDGECDLCGEEISPAHTCADGDSDHKCDVCKEPLSECADTDEDHDCDLCGETLSQCADTDEDGACDICGEALTPDHTCADGDSDHKCDVCEEPLSECADTDEDHDCDLCGETLSQCADEDEDGECDICGEALTPDHTCADENSDHKCDVCEEPLSECADTDEDHDCDLCGKTLSQCTDTDEDGECDICGEALTPDHTCTDANKDHRCDTCKETISQCTDANKDHKCDECTKVLSTCADKNANHKCDVCDKTLSWCVDTDADGDCNFCKQTIPQHTCTATYRAHQCDVCSAVLSAHTDKNSDHHCDFCSVYWELCSDENNDHLCDVCGEKKTECMDVDVDRRCDICKEAYTHSETADGSALSTENVPSAGYYGVYATDTDTGTYNTTVNFPDGMACYRFYLHFAMEVDNVRITDGEQYGLFTAGAGYIKNGRFIVPMLYTPRSTQQCTEISMHYIRFVDRATGGERSLTTGIYFRFVRNCVVPNFLGVSTDGNLAHASNVASVKFTDVKNPPADGFYIYLHFDGPIGGGGFLSGSSENGGSIINNRNYVLYENGNYILKAEVNVLWIGTYRTEVNYTWCPVDGLAGMTCDLFTIVVEPGVRCAQCAPDTDEDGRCDACGNLIISCTHRDENSDHICDACGYEISFFVDTDKNHLCDVCGKIPFECHDSDMDHICDICGAPLVCINMDGDHECDICKAKLSNCIDNDQNERCDICGEEISPAHTCADTDNDHKCDTCEKTLSQCADGNEDHKCDLCEEVLTPCSDKNSDHICDICKIKFTKCKDDDQNSVCDVCGNPIENIEALRNPYMIGYSTELDGNFFENLGLLQLTYGKANTVYLKFNCEVDFYSFSFLDLKVDDPVYCYQDAEGVVYSVEIPASDRIFVQGESHVYFGTPYSTECFAPILFDCLPETMPAYLGTVVDGNLSYNHYPAKPGETMTVQFALNVEVELGGTLFANGFAVTLVSQSHESAPDGTYYIYTVSFGGQDVSAYESFELAFTYSYLGAFGGSDGDAFLPTFYVPVQIVPYVLLDATVNGISVYETFAQIPYSEAYEILLTLNQPADVLEMAFEGLTSGELYSEENGTYVYRFISSNLPFGYVNAPIIAHNGSYPSHFAALSFEILEDYTGGGEGGEIGGGEGGGEGDLTELPTVIEIYDCVNETPISDKDVLNVWADGKLSIRVTFDRPVYSAFLMVNGERYDAEFVEYDTVFYFSTPLSMFKADSFCTQEGYLQLYIEENGVEFMLMETTYEQDAFVFYGIYQNPYDLVLENSPSATTLRAGREAVVYLAMTAAVDPTQLYIAGFEYHLTPVDNPWWDPVYKTDAEGNEIRVYIYEVLIPAEILSKDYGAIKLAFAIDQGAPEEYLYDIWATYSINID